MKRFTFMFVAWICMLCATGLPAAHAVNAGDKITQLSDLSNTAAYTIENTINGRGYMAYHPDYNATTGGLGLAGVTLSGYQNLHKQVDNDTVNIHFQIIQDDTDDTKYYFYSIGAGKYLYVDGTTLKLTGTEANRTGFTAEELTSGGNKYLRFTLEVNGNTHYLTFACDYNSTNQLPVRIERDVEDNAQYLTITYIGETVNVNFTYKINIYDYTEKKYNKKTYTTVSNFPQVVGKAPYAPAQAFLKEYGYDRAKVTSGGNIEVTCTQDLPFALTSNLDQPEWYIFYFNPDDTKYMMKYNPDDGKLLSDTQGTLTQEDYTFASDDRFMWCIMGNLVDGFKLYNKYNKKAGTNLTLNATAPNPTVGTAENNNDLWKLTKYANGQYACFQSMTLEGDNYIAPSSDNFAYDTANGSSSFVCVPWYKYAVEKLQNLRFLDGAVGMADVPQDIIDKVTNNDFVEIELGPWTNEGCVAKVNKNIQDRLAVTDTVAFKPGYYYVYSAHQNGDNGSLFESGKGIYYDKTTSSMRWGTIVKNDPDYIVQFTQAGEGKYYLLAPNAKKYMQGCTGATGETTTADSPITFVKLGERQGQYKLHFGDGITYANEHGEGSGTGSNLINTDGGLNSASAWYLIPAETIDIAMNEVGNSSYASTYLPFAVKNITNNTFVSTISIEQDESGTVALGVPQTVLSKECGAVIRNNNKAKTVTLQILDEEPAESTTSSLTGTLQGTTVAASSVLTFGRDKSNTANVGFYKYSGTTIKPNKAYLETSALPNGLASIRLVWGDGTTTDIDSTTLLPANVDAPVFDLSGRRVNRLQRGHIYLQRGRKFIAQ